MRKKTTTEQWNIRYKENSLRSNKIARTVGYFLITGLIRAFRLLSVDEFVRETAVWYMIPNSEYLLMDFVACPLSAHTWRMVIELVLGVGRTKCEECDVTR